MPLTKEVRTTLVGDYRRHEKDSGSPEVQIALLTRRIIELTDHMRAHRKDFSSRRGLLKLVSQRNSLLKYLARVDREGYQKLIARLGLRK